jgi:hypothetical protein
MHFLMKNFIFVYFFLLVLDIFTQPRGHKSFLVKIFKSPLTEDKQNLI